MGVGGTALRHGFALADRVVPARLHPSLAPHELIRAAGVSPSAAARLGLDRLVAAIAAESRLNLFGALSLRWDFMRLMRNAALVEDAHRAEPALAQAGIEAPVFILGLPRSGTSFLHDLLAQDEESAVPRVWQTIHPAPRPRGFDAASDKRVRDVDGQLNLFAALAPGFSALHPTSADAPQECSEITAHVFQSLRFDTTFRVPSYLAWLEAHGHEQAFAFHRRFLQFLQNGTPARWVLKCPDHTFTLDAIIAAYPDARFVIVHRDPIAVLGSNARLTEVLRRTFLRDVDPAEIGRLEAARWTHGANLLVDFDQRADIPAARKLHIHHDDLIAAPLAVVSQIYAQFDMDFTLAAQTAMSRRLAARPNGGYARHAPYTLDNFQISAESLTAQFAPYVSAYCRASLG
jgi:hypothetical protein